VIIKNGYVLQQTVVKKDVCIEENSISQVGKNLHGADIFDATGMLVMPGFVNTHTHLAMTLLRGYADDMPLQEWLYDYIWPREAHLTAEDCYYGNLLGIIEMLHTGTTCFSDMYFYEDQALKAAQKAGIRAVLSYGMTDRMCEERGMRVINQTHNLLHEIRNNGLIDVGFGPHSPYTCSPEFLMKIQDYAQKEGKIVHIHLHETQAEINEFKDSHGKSPLEFLESIGFLQDNVCAAHVVHCSIKEREILKKRNVKVLHCPSSNLKLSNGVAPVSEMMEEGICVTLGTDGAAANNTLDMIRETRLMTLLQKMGDPSGLCADSALTIATENGGKALGWNTGKIAPGYCADMIFIDLNHFSMTPRHNFLSNVVYSLNASAVDTVIIHGNMVMKKGKILTLNEEDILEKAQAHAYDLLNR
jgi:5-methylthioadenosine/S-adenosylhomocysteine deaminase